MTEIEWYHALMEQPHAIFVFGSNTMGVHGAGAAEAAAKFYGAVRGLGSGFQGRSYSIPTVGDDWLPRSLEDIDKSVQLFLSSARKKGSGHLFVLTRVGCGLGGYSNSQIAPLFRGYGGNIVIPTPWIPFLRN